MQGISSWCCDFQGVGIQPIHFAAMCDQQDIIVVLIDEYGVSPNSKSQVGIQASLLLAMGS